ncbi:hypothetical protein PENSPDRAFT_674461 [Peniophora sp. CONT]|nr:hypothetical protein PENSPDRAFT_674461 [Peniophora sp. CONT]
MFGSFLRTLPEITLFHSKSSPTSVKALALLQSALSNPYPPHTSKGPLKFTLNVAEHPPTADQVRTILPYITQSDSPSVLLSSHPSAPSGEDRPTTPEGVVDVATRTPNALKWPIVVDWNSGRAAAGNLDGVVEMLEHLRKVRDGEVKES